MRLYKFNLSLIFSFSLFLGAISSHTHAQDEARSFGLEEIVVTAQKREQNINDVGMTIDVATGDALKTAGDGSWFRVVERNGIDNLVRERQIVRSGRQDFAKANEAETYKELNPLLFAGIIIEGGIIGYDTNLESGGRGARTLGVGVSRMYRKDAVTVSLRAVSVLTGEVLLNVQTRKTILSYGGGGDVFRFIEQGTQLIEFEDGVGNNESVTYATRSAVEAAVFELINQGHDRGFWEIEGKEK